MHKKCYWNSLYSVWFVCKDCEEWCFLNVTKQAFASPTKCPVSDSRQECAWKESKWIVNVWFGEGDAKVSEEFGTKEEAFKFADRYTPEMYPECTIKIFSPNGEEVNREIA